MQPARSTTWNQDRLDTKTKNSNHLETWPSVTLGCSAFILSRRTGTWRGTQTGNTASLWAGAVRSPGVEKGKSAQEMEITRRPAGKGPCRHEFSTGTMDPKRIRWQLPWVLRAGKVFTYAQWRSFGGKQKNGKKEPIEPPLKGRHGYALGIFPCHLFFVGLDVGSGSQGADRLQRIMPGIGHGPWRLQKGLWRYKSTQFMASESRNQGAALSYSICACLSLPLILLPFLCLPVPHLLLLPIPPLPSLPHSLSLFLSLSFQRPHRMLSISLSCPDRQPS